VCHPCPGASLDLLGHVVLVDAGTALRALGRHGSLDGILLLLEDAVNVLLENWVGVNLFKFGLEVLEAGSVGAAVGATTSIGHVEASVLDFLAVNAPVDGHVSLCFLAGGESKG
jgi:hypothetical protein